VCTLTFQGYLLTLPAYINSVYWPSAKYLYSIWDKVCPSSNWESVISKWTDYLSKPVSTFTGIPFIPSTYLCHSASTYNNISSYGESSLQVRVLRWKCIVWKTTCIVNHCVKCCCLIMSVVSSQWHLVAVWCRRLSHLPERRRLQVSTQLVISTDSDV